MNKFWLRMHVFSGILILEGLELEYWKMESRPRKGIWEYFHLLLHCWSLSALFDWHI